MKKLSLIILIILGALTLTNNANSASFDCNKTGTWVEKTICASSTLSKLDSAMAKKYKHNLFSTSGYEDGETLKGNMIIDQRLWLKFQRNTCKDTACLIREYKEYLEAEAAYSVASDFPDELSDSVLPSKNAFGEFSEAVRVPVENRVNKDWEITIETTNAISIHRVASKPYLSIVDGMLIFTNAHTCEIDESLAVWSQNHWVITDDQRDEAVELRLYPAIYNGKNQLLLKDINYQFREGRCGVRGYFDGIVLNHV